MPVPGLELRSILLPVTDLAAAVRFYRDEIGLELKFQDGDVYAEFIAGACKITLATPADHPVPDRALPVFRAADVLVAVERLVAGGATMIVEPAEGPHEIRAVLRGPDGNAFVVYSSRG